MSRNDDRPIGGDEESERLNQAGAGARVTGVHGVGAPDVTDHDVPAAERPGDAAPTRPADHKRPDRRRSGR